MITEVRNMIYPSKGKVVKYALCQGQTVKNVRNQKNWEILTHYYTELLDGRQKRNGVKSHYLPDASICKYALAASSNDLRFPSY
jgi:hypothetical protein